MRKRWRVTWYNVVGDPIRDEQFWTLRGAERRRQQIAPPVWVPDLFASIAERINEESYADALHRVWADLRGRDSRGPVPTQGAAGDL